MFVGTMTSGLKTFLQRWIINTLAVLVATKIVPGIQYDSPTSLFVATLVLGILNAFVRPLVMLLSLPLLLLTLGLFTLVINAALLLAVSGLMRPHFVVQGFWSAFFGALVISIVSLVLNTITGTGNSRVEVRRKGPETPPRDDGGGPIIDV
jgi:putative membrane protein